MSYILEALKKSQQARERGQVPRLQTTAFEQPSEPGRLQPWMLVVLGLAAFAVLLTAAMALLRPTPVADPLASMEALAPAGLRQGMTSGAGVEGGGVMTTATSRLTDAKALTPID
jgi:general secretion pathway protein B